MAFGIMILTVWGLHFFLLWDNQKKEEPADETVYWIVSILTSVVIGIAGIAS